jgi:hypothetical protein
MFPHTKTKRKKKKKGLKLKDPKREQTTPLTFNENQE